MNASGTGWDIGIVVDGMHFDNDYMNEWSPSSVTIGGVAVDTTQANANLYISVPLPSPKDPRWITVKHQAAYYYWIWYYPAVRGYRYMTLPLDITMPDGGKLSENTDNLPMQVYIEVAENYT